MDKEPAVAIIAPADEHVYEVPESVVIMRVFAPLQDTLWQIGLIFEVLESRYSMHLDEGPNVSMLSLAG